MRPHVGPGRGAEARHRESGTEGGGGARPGRVRGVPGLVGLPRRAAVVAVRGRRRAKGVVARVEEEEGGRGLGRLGRFGRVPERRRPQDEDESSRPTTPKTPDFATGLGKKPSPKDRIQATLHNTLDSTQLVRSAHATAVPPVRVVTEKMREREIVRDVRKREKKDREQNAIESRPVSRADEKSAATFVREGLDTQAVMDALRQANMLSKLKQGPRAPLGLAINQAIQSSSKSEQDKKSSVVVSKPHQLGISNPHLKITTRDMIKRRQPVSKNSPEPPGSADSS